MTVANELTLLFIPEPERKRFEAGEQSDRLHSLKQWLGFVAALQIVVRNPRAEVMDVVEAYVAGEPLQNLG